MSTKAITLSRHVLDDDQPLDARAEGVGGEDGDAAADGEVASLLARAEEEASAERELILQAARELSEAVGPGFKLAVREDDRAAIRLALERVQQQRIDTCQSMGVIA